MSYGFVSKFGSSDDAGIYALIISLTTGKMWNGSSMVTIDPDDRADYAIEATALGDGNYGHTIPAGLPSGDTYLLRAFVPDDSSADPAADDVALDETHTFTKAAATADDDDEPETIADAIEQNAKGPRSVTGDSGSVTQHSLQDQIEADRYTRNKAAAAAGGMGIKFVKLIPPGQE